MKQFPTQEERQKELIDHPMGVSRKPTEEEKLLYPNLKHIKHYMSDVYENKYLYYIGTSYPLEKFKRYRLYKSSYSPSPDVLRKDVWIVVDENYWTFQPLFNKPVEIYPGLTKIHVELSEFTEDVSTWREANLDNILKVI